MKLKTERYLSDIDPLTVEFFQNNGMSSICVILLTNIRKDGRKDRQTNGKLVTHPTHLHGHTLDIILSPSDQSIVHNVKECGFISGGPMCFR